MRLIADGGSTKVEWVLLDENNDETLRATTLGINPLILSAEAVADSISGFAKNYPATAAAEEIEFYGAGCNATGSAIIRECLQKAYPDARKICVGSDIIGAARALLGSEEGIACILGTGANSCLWDGHEIVRQTPALGFILGDEGSGAVLGKLFINALYKGVLPEELKTEFEQAYDTDMLGVIEHVYRQPGPNRWLASLSPFIHEHLHIAEVERLVEQNFEQFIVRNLLPYQRPDLPVCFIGSIAMHYREQLTRMMERHGLTVGRIQKSPL